MDKILEMLNLLEKNIDKFSADLTLAERLKTLANILDEKTQYTTATINLTIILDMEDTKKNKTELVSDFLGNDLVDILNGLVTEGSILDYEYTTNSIDFN